MHGREGEGDEASDSERSENSNSTQKSTNTGGLHEIINLNNDMVGNVRSEIIKDLQKQFEDLCSTITLTFNLLVSLFISRQRAKSTSRKVYSMLIQTEKTK